MVFLVGFFGLRKFSLYHENVPELLKQHQMLTPPLGSASQALRLPTHAGCNGVQGVAGVAEPAQSQEQVLAIIEEPVGQPIRSVAGCVTAQQRGGVKRGRLQPPEILRPPEVIQALLEGIEHPLAEGAEQGSVGHGLSTGKAGGQSVGEFPAFLIWHHAQQAVADELPERFAGAGVQILHIPRSSRRESALKSLRTG